MYIYNLYSTNLLIYEVLKKRRLTTRTDHLQLRIVDDIKYNQGFPSAKDVFITWLRRAYRATSILKHLQIYFCSCHAGM